MNTVIMIVAFSLVNTLSNKLFSQNLIDTGFITNTAVALVIASDVLDLIGKARVIFARLK